MTSLSDWVHLDTDADLGARRTREATPDERIELARELDVLACDALKASYTITPLAKGRFRFEGTIDATVTQACVVTLDPITTDISEPFSVIFGPPEQLEAEEQQAGEREILSIPDVELVQDGRLEVGTVIFGLLSAALPPYPRVPDVTFDWKDPKAEGDAGATGAFAALAKLKPKS